MKIYPEKISGELSRTLLPAYVVSGDEPLLIQEVCDEVRAALHKAGYIERDLFHVETGFDWSQVLHSNNSISLFAEKKILELRMASDKPGDQGARALTELVQNQSEDNCLLLVMPRVSAATQRTKWFKTVESTSGFIQVWPIDARNLPGWLANRFRRAGLQASREAVQALAYKTEGNLLAAVQEIERMKLCSDSNRIDLQQVLGGVEDNSRYDVFLLIDAALKGNTERVIKIVEGLQLEGTAPLYLNFMLARELRTLSAMAFKMEQGQSLGNAMKSSRVWNNRREPVTACLRRHSVNSLERLQLRLTEVDRMVKGLTPGRPWDELASTLMVLSA